MEIYIFKTGFLKTAGKITQLGPMGFSLRKNDGFSTEASPWSSPRAVSCLGKQPADDRDEDDISGVECAMVKNTDVYPLGFLG